MSFYQKIILHCALGVALFGGVAVLPAYVFAAADSGIVPCGTETYPADAVVNGKQVGGTVSNPCGFDDIIKLINNLTNFFIITGAALSAVAFGYAGFLMMTAHGEMGKIEEAKSIFGKVLVGFLFMISAWLIVHAIEAAFLDTSPGKFKSLLG